MTWVKNKLEELKKNGFKMDVADLGLKDGDGKLIKEMQFGTLNNSEVRIIESLPEIISIKNSKDRSVMIGTRVLYERLLKHETSLNWEEFQLLDTTLLGLLTIKVNEGMGVDLKNYIQKPETQNQ